MTSVIKPISNTISIDSVANTVFNATVVKVNNDNSYATLVFKYANNVQYADIPMNKGESVLVEKDPTDKLVGTGMNACAVAWPKG